MTKRQTIKYLKQLAEKYGTIPEYKLGMIEGQIAAELVKYRITHNLSHKDLEEKLEFLCSTYIEGIENGDVDITLETMVRLADKLGGEFNIEFKLPKPIKPLPSHGDNYGEYAPTYDEEDIVEMLGYFKKEFEKPESPFKGKLYYIVDEEKQHIEFHIQVENFYIEMTNYAANTERAAQKIFPNWTFYVDIHMGDMTKWDIPEEILTDYLVLSEEEE
jgi:transcriptional regulator with XRE-family HTH domain